MNFLNGGRSFIHTIKDNRWLLIMSAPGLLIILIFSYLPMFGLVLAFKNYRVADGILGSEWTGFDNFLFLFGTKDALRVTINTLWLNTLFIVTNLIFSIFVALLMNEVRRRWQVKLYQSALFLPYFLSWIIVSYFVLSLLSYDKGIVNQLLEAAGFSPVEWYNEPGYWPVILTLINLWKNVGYTSLIYFAGMMTIDQSYYEAAEIDGATKWQQVRHITVPLLVPLIVIMTLLAIGRIFYADFGLFYNVTLNVGALYSTTDVIDTYVFRMLRVVGDTGMAAAAGFYQSFVGLVLILSVNYLVRRIDRDKSLF